MDFRLHLGGLLELFSGIFGLRFRGRFSVISLTREDGPAGGLGEPPGSLNLKGSGLEFNTQALPLSGGCESMSAVAQPAGWAPWGPMGSHRPPYQIYLMTTSVVHIRGGWVTPVWPHTGGE